MFINTNKTARLHGGGRKNGYEIKWENRDLLSALVYLREWQKEHNPVSETIHVNSLSDSSLHCSKLVEHLLPECAFLFRDPASRRTSRQEPVSYARLSVMFVHLLAEVERRLRDAGMDVVLVSEWEERADGGRVPVAGVVTLHSLRVSGITNFAEFGVPLQIITEFIAGHSTILMNIWYQKFGFTTISSVIQRAARSMNTAEGLAQLNRWLDELGESVADIEANHESMSGMGAFVVGSEDGMASFAQQSPGLWSVGIDGICPNGRTLCHEGGPRIGTKGWTRSTPVPGGAGNCPRCRFWITGPMFVFGQIVKANVLLYHIQEKAENLRRIENELADLQVAPDESPATLTNIAGLRSSIEVIDAEIENALYSWVARYKFAEQSVSKLQGAEGSQRHQLITSGAETIEMVRMSPSGSRGSASHGDSDENTSDIELALMDAHRLDLLEFVNQACEIVPGVEVPSAMLRKAKLLDALLDREGRSPFFYKLSDQDALRAGNAATRFLTDLVGVSGVSSLLAGDASLAELGLTSAFEEALEVSRSITLPGQPANQLNAPSA